MAPVKKLNVEVKVKSDADKFWKGYMDSHTFLPRIFPDIYKTIEVIEGDGKSAGSVHLIHFAEATQIVNPAKEKIEEVDETKKKMTYSVIEGDALQNYKSIISSVEVIPEAAGSLAKWECEFEKTSDEAPDPVMFIDFAAKKFKEIDAYLLKA